MTQEYKSIKFKFNLPYIVKLKFDKPIEKEGEYGTFWVYGVEHDGGEYSFIASMGLNNLLLAYKKGDIVEIIKIDDENGKSHFVVEQLSEEDIKSAEQPPPKLEIARSTEKDWDKITAVKDHKILIQVSMKLAVQSFPINAKFTDKDYEEIEIRMVKFNAMVEKYLGVTMKEPEQKTTTSEHKFSPLVQAKFNEFDKYLEENKAIENYKKVRSWLDSLKDPTTKVLTEQLAKLKESLEPSGEYESYHESLITACCDTLKTKDRLPIIQTLTNMVKAWKIKGTEGLSDTTENECLNLLEEFDNQLKEEEELNSPY